LAVGIVFGFILDILVIRKLRKHKEKTLSKDDDRIINSLGKYPTILSILSAIYISSFRLSIGGENLMDAFRRLTLALMLVLLSIVSARLGTIMIGLLLKRSRGQEETSSLFSNIARGIIYLIGLLLILSSLGVNVTAALTALGVGGLAVALALQDTLSNLFAGFYIIAARKIQKGDFIELESGERGFVEDVSWRNTVVRHLQNYDIIIPNSKVGSSTVNNYNLPIKEISILIDLGVGYESDLDHVEQVTLEVARKVMREITGGVPDYEPMVRYNEFADSSINFSVIMRGKFYTDQYLLTHEFIKALHKRYKKEGIEIPYPHLVNLKK
jgi:small-conductance mechanosensitive channel